MFGCSILLLELRLAARRGRKDLFRYFYAVYLTIGFLILYVIYRNAAGAAANKVWEISQASGSAMRWFLMQQLALLFLATPALAAGAITDEKERGTLQLLFGAGLSSADIIMGKWLARLTLIGNIFVAALPFVFAVGNFASWRLEWLFLIVVQTMVIAAALAAASLLASVWTRHARDAVLGLYVAAGAAWLLLWAGQFAVKPRGGFLDDALHLLDPVYVWQPLWTTDDVEVMQQRLLTNLGLWGLFAFICLTLAVARLRPAYFRQMEAGSKQRQVLTWTARPPVTDAPCRWHEKCRAGLAPLPYMRQLPRWFGLIVFATSVAVITLPVVKVLAANNFPELLVSQFLYFVGSVGVLVASLVVGIRCSGVITGERERDTWEALLLSPLTSREVVRDKMRGAIEGTGPYFVVFAIPPMICAICAGFDSTIVWIGWLGMMSQAIWFSASAGVWCSARARSSWRSLLATLAWTYLGSLLVYGVLAAVVLPLVWHILIPFLWLLAALIIGLASLGNLMIPLPRFHWGIMGGAAVFFLIVFWGYCIRRFMRQAEQRVEEDRGQDLRDHLVNRLSGGALRDYLYELPEAEPELAMSHTTDDH